jgi:hypothetical protein
VKLLPSRTVYGTKNWPDPAGLKKAEPSGSAFFCAFFLTHTDQMWQGLALVPVR